MKTFVSTLFLAALCLFVLTSCKTKKGGGGKVASDFSVEIYHLGCRGNCPAYSMKVDAQGNAKYNGRHAVEMIGDYTKKLDAKTVEAMAKSITDAHFFDFAEEYGGGVADLPGVKTTVVMDGKTKAVNDLRDAPKELKELEAKLEELFGKEGWTKVN